MRTMTLAEILTPEQLAEVERLLKQPEPFKAVKAYLITQRESLEAKDVLPEYLAYVIQYLVSQRVTHERRPTGKS